MTRGLATNRALIRSALTGLPAFAASSSYAQNKQVPPVQVEVHENEVESIWTRGYANCDYGFYANLPPGYIGHGTHSPNPNHGFLVGLPNPDTTAEVSRRDRRYIWVNAEYNSFELKSLKEAADWQVKISASDKPEFKVGASDLAKLDGLPAICFEFQYKEAERTIAEGHVVALRSGILYPIGLRTTPGAYLADRIQYQKIVNSFRGRRIHYCS